MSDPGWAALNPEGWRVIVVGAWVAACVALALGLALLGLGAWKRWRKVALGGALLALVGAGIAWPAAAERRATDDLLACRRNVEDLAGGARAFADGNRGGPPRRLGLLVPFYLARMRTCPVAATDTYSSTYAANQHADAFTVYCRGSWHRVGGQRLSDFPRWLPGEGLVPPPGR
ncbi:MAG: hypothetical protein FJX76_16285 [Armatimonadetes bacterium]|nr:hypothetical protein [Armatimonadota bacterium]